MTIFWAVRLLAIGVFVGVGLSHSIDWHSIVDWSREGSSNDVTALLIGKELNNFREAMQKERSLLETPLSDRSANQETQYSVPDDFYLSDDTWQMESANQLQLSSLVVSATSALTSVVVQITVVTIATTKESCVLLATTRDVTVTCYIANGQSRTSTSAFDGILSVAGMTSDNAELNSGQLIAFVLHHREDSNHRVTWWDVFHDVMGDGSEWHQLGSLMVDSGATFIRLVPVHVTDSFLLAVGGRQAIEVYAVDTEISFVVPCTSMEASNATDLASFHINGQLYLVVASGQPGASVVWKYDSHGDNFVFHHGLDDDAIENVEYFRRGHDHHLATAGPGGASMYRWAGSRLLRTQKWDRSTAASHPVWHSVYRKRMAMSEEDDVVLVLATDEGAALYTWNNHQKLFVDFVDTECIRWKKQSQSPAGATVMYTDLDVRDFCVGEKSCVGIATGDDGADLPIGDVGDETFVTYRPFVQKVLGPVDQCWQSPMSDVQLASFARIDCSSSTIVIGSGESVTILHAYFENRIPNSSGSTDEYISVERLEIQLERQRTTLQETRSLLDRISADYTKSAIVPQEVADVCPGQQRRLTELKQRLHQAENQLESLLTRGTTIRVSGNVQLKSLTVSGDAKLGGDAKVDVINGVNVTKLLVDTVMDGSTGTIIGGVKTFRGDVSIEGPIQVRKLLNSHRIPHDLLMLNRPQTTRGAVEFRAPVTVSGDLNVANHVNGIDLSSEVIRLDDARTHLVTGGKSFLEVVTVEDEVTIGGSVNGLKPSLVAANTVTSHASPRLTRIGGVKTFVRAKVLGHVNVGGLVSGVNLVRLASTAVRKDRPANVVATKRFVQTVRVVGDGRRLMSMFINGLGLPDDVVLHSDHGAAKLASKTFRGTVTISGNLVVDGRLDGVNVSDVALVDGDQKLCGEKIFRGRVTASGFSYRQTRERVAAERAIVHGSLHVTTSLNNNDVNDLMRDVILKNETDIIFGAPVVFEQRQTLEGNVYVEGTIDGLNLEKDFVLADHGNVITGTKEFLGPVSIAGDATIKGSWDGVDLRELDRETVRTNGAGTVRLSGRKTFLDGVTVEHLQDDDDETVVEFGDLRAENVQVEKDVTVKGKVNSVDFGQVASSSITLSTDQTIDGSLTFGEDNVVDHLRVLGKVNGVDVGELWEDVLWRNATRKQVVTGQNNFTGRLVAPYVTTKKTINGVSLAEIDRRTIRVADGTFRGEHYRFSKVEVEGSAILAGDINGLSFSRLVEDSVVSTGRSPVSVSGRKEFVDLHVKGNVFVAGTVNGLVLQRDVLTTSSPHNVTGHYVFRDDVIAGGGVSVRGAFRVGRLSDGVSSYEQRKVVFDGDASVDVLRTGGRLNGMDLDRLRADAVADAKADEISAVAETKTRHLVDGAHFLKNLTVLGTINNFDYSTFFEQVVLNDGALKVIVATKEFSASLSAERIAVEGNLVVGKRLNGIDIAAMAKDDPRKVKVIGGAIVIPRAVTVHGNVTIGNSKGDNSPPHDASSCGTVPRTTLVKELRVSGSVYASAVNEWNLTALAMDTLRWTSEVQEVTGRKTVTGAIRFHHRATTDRPNAAAGSLKELNGRFDPPWNAYEPISDSGVADHPESSYNVERCPMSECDIADSILDSFQQTSALSQNVDSVQRSATYRNRVSAFDVLSSKLNGSGVYLAVGFSDCRSPMRLYLWNRRDGQFVFDGEIRLHHVRKMIPLVLRGRQFIVVHHLICSLDNRNEEALSLVDVMSGVIRRIDIQKLPTSLLDFDVMQGSDGAKSSSYPVLCLLHLDGVLTIATLLSKGTIHRTSETELPAGATHVKWLSKSPRNTESLQRRLVVEFRESGKTKTVVYEVIGTRWQRHKESLRPVQTLESAFLESVDSFPTGSGAHGLVVWTNDEDFGVLRFYELAGGSSSRTWKEVDVLSEVGPRPKSIRVYATHLSSHRVHVAVTKGSHVDVYVRTSGKGVTTKLVPVAKLAVTKVVAVQWFSQNERLYLAVLSENAWSLYEFSGSPDIVNHPKC